MFLLFHLNLFQQKGWYMDKVTYFLLDQGTSTMFATTSFCKHSSYFCKICHYISTTAGYIELWSFHQLRNLMVESDGSLQGAQMDGAIYEAGLFADNQYILCWTPYQSNKLLWTLNFKKKNHVLCIWTIRTTFRFYNHSLFLLNFIAFSLRCYFCVQ